MAGVLNSEFMSDSIHEIVPEVAKVSKSLNQASVLTGRRRVRIIANNGQSFTSTANGGGAQTINFLLQDGASFLDPTSCVLSFDLTTWDNSNPNAPTNANQVAVDDGVWSVFQRLVVSVNSTLMDDIDQLGKKVNSQLYPVVNQSWYDSAGSFMGLWKWSKSAYSQIANKYDMVSRLSNWASVTQPATGKSFPAGQKQKNHFMIPLSLLTGFFANEQLLPLPHMGQVLVQLNLADALSACVCSSSDAVPAFRIDNLTMEADFVEVHPTYGALIARICRDDDGLIMPFDAHLVASQDIGASTTNTQYNIVFSKATQNMRQITTFIQDKEGLSAEVYPKQSTFSNAGFSSIQYRVGSNYFPAFPSQSEQRAYADLQSAFGRPGNSLEESGIVDSYNYYLSSVVTNKAFAPNIPNPGCDCFIHSYSFDRLKGARMEGINLDGINTMSASGAQVVTQLQAAPPSNSVIGCVIRYTRIFRIKNGATSVVG